MSHNAPSTIIAPHPRLELICALWRVTQEPGKPGIGPRALVDQAQAAAFVGRCLTAEHQEALRAPLSHLSLSTAMGLAVQGVDPAALSPDLQSDWRAVTDMIDQTPVQAALESALAELLQTVEFDSDKIWEMHDRSRYSEAQLIKPLLGDNLAVRLVPSLFMDPAPGGKIGFFRDDTQPSALVLAFGYAAQLDNAALDWPQWYRLGIWHMVARQYWAGLFAAQAFPTDMQAASFERLPPSFRYKVGIHDFTISTHKSWASYMVDCLVAATKVLCEEELQGPAAAAEQSQWLMSLGRFQIPWFIGRLRGRALGNVELSELAQDWNNEIAGLTSAAPHFSGPLGACESPLWNANLRLVFSPSVDKISRRTLALWFNKYWPVKPEVADVAEPFAGDWDNHCNLVFCLTKDELWARPFLTETGLIETEELPAQEIAGWRPPAGKPFALAYVRKNQTCPQYWTRVCIAPDEELLTAVHQRVRYYADWSALVDGVRDSGPISYGSDGSLCLERKPEES